MSFWFVGAIFLPFPSLGIISKFVVSLCNVIGRWRHSYDEGLWSRLTSAFECDAFAQLSSWFSYLSLLSPIVSLPVALGTATKLNVHDDIEARVWFVHLNAFWLWTRVELWRESLYQASSPEKVGQSDRGNRGSSTRRQENCINRQASKHLATQADWPDVP